MSDEKNKALDLDELFGQARALKVKWQGKEYELLKLEGISPTQAARFQKLRNRANLLQSQRTDNDDEEMSQEQAEELENIFDEMLGVLSKELPRDTMSFAMKMRILTWYIEETQGPNALETALNKATGATSSQG